MQPHSVKSCNGFYGWDNSKKEEKYESLKINTEFILFFLRCLLERESFWIQKIFLIRGIHVNLRYSVIPYLHGYLTDTWIVFIFW